MSISEYQLLNKVLEDKNYSFFTDNMLSDEHFTQAKEEYEYIKEFYEKYMKNKKKRSVIENYT